MLYNVYPIIIHPKNIRMVVHTSKRISKWYFIHPKEYPNGTSYIQKYIQMVHHVQPNNA